MQLIIAVVLSLINYVLTTLVHCCCGLSPRLNLTTNSILLILWLAALGLLCWSMSQTILTTCTTTYWGNATGITVCRIYKAFFSFTATAAASFIAAITLDIIVRKRQTRLGKYDPMLSDVKLEDRAGSGSAMSGSIYPVPPPPPHGPVDNPYTDAGNPYQDHPNDSVFNGGYHQRSISEVGSVSGSQRMAPPPVYGGNNNHLEQYHAGEAFDFSENAPARGAWGVPRVRLSAFDRAGYARPPEQTHYDPGAYR